jgi:hypothetical protein
LVVAIVAACVGALPFGWFIGGGLATIGIILGAVAAKKNARRGKAALIVAVCALVENAAMYGACVACHRVSGGHGNLSLATKCWNDGDCRAWGGGHCVNGSCEACRDDKDCRGEFSSHCAEQRCVECVTDAHCAHTKLLDDRLPFCSETNRCIACRTNTDCPSGKRCLPDDRMPGGVTCAVGD